MKHTSTLQDGIHANLKALHRILAAATKESSAATGYMASGKQNMAVGTVFVIENYLEQATSLYKAVIAMHRCKL